MKSVRTRIMFMTCALVVVSLLIVSTVSVYLNMQTTNGTLEQTMVKMAEIASKQVSNNLRVYKVVAEAAARDERVHNPLSSPEEKQEVLDGIAAQYHDITRGNILDTSGTSIFTGDNFSDREYFQKAIQLGQTWVSDPVISKVTGTASIIIAAPIWQDGVYGTNVTGVLYLVPTETFLNDIVKGIKISTGAGAQIINSKGEVVAHPNPDLLFSNAQVNEKTDAAMIPIAALEREMMAGKTGFGTYSMFGVEKYLGYAPIEASNGWSVGVNAPLSDFMGYTNTSIIVTVILLIVAIIIAIIVSIRMANGIGKPLNVLAEILSNIAGTGSVALEEATARQVQAYSKNKDETGMLASSASGLIDMLQSKVENLNAISNGDLTTNVVCMSDSDAIGNALSKMLDNLNSMFGEINSSTSQVANGSKQIANGSQALAQGSTQQAAAVEQLSSSISAIAEKTKINADMAGKAAALADTIKGNAEKGNRQMDEMMTAVKEINDASQNINKVISVIDSIAFQTNILALNAAVEAARAGQHGKGFAVVAEEVRNLASKSADAAKETGTLIANSMEKAALGARIADETAASLIEIVAGINESNKLVGEIAKSSEEQASGITQINVGIDQVAQVIQQNSATAEQSASASEAMSGQTDMLESLISQFKLKGGTKSSISRSAKPKVKLDMPEKPAYTPSIANSDFGKY